MDSKKEKASVDPQVKYHPHLKPKKRCVVPTCPSKYYQICDPTIDFKNPKFMSFPRNVERSKKWYEILKNATGIELDYEDCINRPICAKHFEKKYFIASGNMSRCGFPSLFPLKINEKRKEKQNKKAGVPDNKIEKKSITNPLNLKGEENQIMYLKKIYKTTSGVEYIFFDVPETTIQNKSECETSNLSSLKENESSSLITEDSVSRTSDTINSSPVKNYSNDVQVTTEQLNEYHPLVDHDYYSSATETPGNISPDKSVTYLNSCSNTYTDCKIIKSKDIVQIPGEKMGKATSNNEYFVLELSNTFTPSLTLSEETTTPVNNEKNIFLEIPRTVNSNKNFTNTVEQPEMICDPLDDSFTSSPVHSPISIDQERGNDKYIKSRKIKNKKKQKQKAVVLKKMIKAKLLNKKSGKISLAWQRIINQKRKLQILDKKDVFNLSKCYIPWCPLKDLRNSLVMPYGLSLKTLLHNIPLNSGINPATFSRLKKKVKKMRDINKCCVLLFKTMKLTSKLEYCQESDQILGYQDFNKSEKATAALIFMVQGLKKPWKQPVVYYFVNNHLTATILAQLVIDVITTLQDSGLCVIGTLCNHSLLNRVTLGHLCQENSDCSNTSKRKSPYFVVNNQKIVTMYDPSALLVSTRNALLKYNIEYQPQKFACFNDIIHSYNADKKRSFNKLWKLRQKDLLFRSNNSLKLNVSVAAKTLSYSVASCIEPDLGIQGKNTATFLRNMDLLFDSFNSQKKSKGRTKALNARRGHPLLWKRIIKFINQWVFIDKINGGRKSCLPLKNSWITTIKSAQMLWKICRVKGFKYLRTKSLNLDPLQNLVASVCYFGARNRNPTPYEFVEAFKICVLNNLILPFNAKRICLEDEGIILFNYRDLLKPVDKKNLLTEGDEIENCLAPLLDDSELQISDINNEFLRVAQISRFLLQKLDLSCELCKSSAVVDNSLFDCFKSNDKQIPFLVTGGFSLFISRVYHIIMCVLDRFGWWCNIRRKLRAYLEKNLNFDWFQCSKHKTKVKSRLVNLSVLFLIKEKLKL